MTIAARDLSNYDGAPITLYEFKRVSTPTLSGIPVTSFWRYCSADRDIVIDAKTFRSIPVLDDGVRQSGDAVADQLTISMPKTAEVPLMFVGSPPSDPINAAIFRAHDGEIDFFSAWVGLVGGVTRRDEITAEILCNTVSATLDRKGLRLAWTRNCPLDLYGHECRADPTLFYRAGTVLAAGGNLIVADEYATVPDGRFIGGFVEWIDGLGHADRRGIVAHAGNTIRVLGQVDGLLSGDTTYAFFGCPHNRDGCNAIFNNLPNYGGHASMPDNSPFSGDLIF